MKIHHITSRICHFDSRTSDILIIHIFSQVVTSRVNGAPAGLFVSGKPEALPHTLFGELLALFENTSRSSWDLLVTHIGRMGGSAKL